MVTKLLQKPNIDTATEMLQSSVRGGSLLTFIKAVLTHSILYSSSDVSGKIKYIYSDKRRGNKVHV